MELSTTSLGVFYTRKLEELEIKVNKKYLFLVWAIKIFAIAIIFFAFDIAGSRYRAFHSLHDFWNFIRGIPLALLGLYLFAKAGFFVEKITTKSKSS